LTSFEVGLSFFQHWGQHFFKYYPNPPVDIIIQIENCLHDNDLELHSHLKNNGIKIGPYVWQNLVNLYTDIMTKDQWLTFFDYLITYSEYPEMFCLVLAAEFILNREALLVCDVPDDFVRFFRDLRIKNINATLRKSFKILDLC